MSAPLVSAHGLTVRYGPRPAVESVDIDIAAGEVVGLIGPDGAGKTSTLRVISGLMRASGGVIEAFGLPVWARRRALHRRLGYLAQRFALYGDLTVDENVEFFARLYGVRSWRSRRTTLLARVGLAEFRDRLAERLSGGMKQKLALACTLIHSPDLLVLDEPTTGVDPVTRRELWRLLGDLVADGLTLIVATPDLDEAERCSRVVLMHAGRVVADGTPAALRDRLPGRIVEVVAASRAAVQAAVAPLPELADATVFGASVHVRLLIDGGADERVRAALETAGIVPDEVRATRASLEDVFLHLTRSAGADTRGEAA
jgi:drug efflux transport system ATP-binding protein